MNTFKFKYGKAVLLLIVLVMLLTLAGLGFNVYNVISFFGKDAFKLAVYLIITLLNGVIFVFGVGVLLNSKYVIKNGHINCYFGFIKTKYPLNDVIQITHFKKSEKLVIYFKDAKFTVIVIDSAKFGDFITALKTENPNILVDANTEDENPDQKNKY